MFIIFLDIDGVLVHCQYKVTPGTPLEDFDPVCVENLNHLAIAKKAKIVISSSWRLFHDLDWFQKKFKDSGVLVDVIDVTPEDVKMPESHRSPLSTEYDEQSSWLVEIYTPRGEQIKQWIEENNPDNFLIIDDNVDDIVPSFDKEGRAKIIHVKDGLSNKGLRWRHIEDYLK